MATLARPADVPVVREIQEALMTLLDPVTGLVHLVAVMTVYPPNPRHKSHEYMVTDCDEEAEPGWIETSSTPTCLWCAARRW